MHVRRPDMLSIDAMLHVNADSTASSATSSTVVLNESVVRGMLLVWNQTPNPQTTTLTVPLYYTGLTATALVSQEGAQAPTIHTLARDYSITLDIAMTPMSVTWFLITE